MKIYDNIKEIVKDDMVTTISKGSKVSIAAACFSMYAYKELKKQLDSVEEFRFIFTSPTFTTEKASKAKREFYIPRLSRETSLYGTEFEIKLRNEMTQKAIARECADWIRKKATFKSNTTGENMGGFMTVDASAEQVAYMPLGGFTTVDIGCERGNNSYNMVNRMEAPFSTQYMQLFETLWNDKSKMQDVTEEIIDSISSAYNENAPEFIYFMKCTMFSANSWMIFQRMNCRMKLPGSKRARFGRCCMTSSVMPFSPSSTNWKNTMAASWQTALVSVRPSLLWQL